VTLINLIHTFLVMSNNFSESSFLDPYLRIYNERQEAFVTSPNFSFINDLNIDNYFDFYNETLGDLFNNSQVTKESTQLLQEHDVVIQEQHDVVIQEQHDVVIQEQHDIDQEVMQYDYQSNEESDCIDENDDPMIEAGATFPNWNFFENALKRYELEIGFRAIKFRLERDNNGTIIRRYFVCENSKEHQPKKKFVNSDHRERESKKIGCQWQLNVGYQKISGEIVINKLVNNHNHSLAPYRKEFAPSLRSFSQEEYKLGTKAQRRYIAKKFPNQPLYDRDLYNAIRQYKNQIGNQ
ncbi:2528_t:CDS:2, partial [Dentiscutata heterogama]